LLANNFREDVLFKAAYALETAIDFRNQFKERLAA
jgi:hypothetical protein